MTDFIDRAAKAAYEAYYANAVGLVAATWDQDEHGRRVARAQVRAVLEAIREPTRELLDAGGSVQTLPYDADSANVDIGDDDAERVWQSMIAAALKPEACP